MKLDRNAFNAFQLEASNLINSLKENKFDRNTKENLLNLLAKAFRFDEQYYYCQPLLLQLRQSCQQYDQYLKQYPHSKLPPSPTFKDIYPMASKLKIFEYRKAHITALNYHFYMDIPIREKLYFIKDIKSAIIDRLIEEEEILASEKENLMEKAIIYCGNIPYKMLFVTQTVFLIARHLKFEYKP
jgi:hypothetical protein